MILDTFFQRYSWDWEIYRRQPEQLIQELTQVIIGEAEAERDYQAGSSSPVKHRTREEFISQVAAAGLPIHPAMFENGNN